MSYRQIFSPEDNVVITRRKFLASTAVLGTAGLLSPYIIRPSYATYEQIDFFAPLNIPPEIHGKIVNGKKVYDLKLQNGKTRFIEGLDTPTVGINGSYLGPTIRAARGDKVVLNVTNGISESSILHWHGVHLPAEMDGGPHQSINVNETWKAEFEIKQPASMLWYHSHMHHRTAIQVYYGLAGLFYLDDENSQSLSLPKDYGVNDIPLVIQDRSFNQDGSFQYSLNMHSQMAGFQGNEILVNGVVRPKLDIKQKQMRFRLLNGSNSRIYNLEFSDQRDFIQIASDGGLLEQPVKLRQLRLSPGERAEIVVEFANNQDVMLQHKPLPKTSSGTGRMGMMMRMMSNDDYPFNVMRFISNKVEGEVVKIASQLATLPAWDIKQVAKTRLFELNMRMGMMGGGSNGVTINNKSFDLDRIDEVVKLNDIEVWEFYNNSPLPHPMHIHDIQFRILTRNGKPPAPNERGLKDTVLVNPNETVRVITKFENYADENRPYMYHCHNLEHEDNGMMGQFIVKA